MNKTQIKRCDSLTEDCIYECFKGREYLLGVKNIYDKGDLIVYPTETLYALGANPFNIKALERLFEVKKRPKNMPISVAVSDIEMMKSLAEVNKLAEKIYEKFLPGPVTLLLKKKGNVSDLLVSGDDKVAIRVPSHPLALKIIDIVGPITATSANIHGNLEPKNIDIALGQLGEKVNLYLDCGECQYKKVSTIVDVALCSTKIIRKGVIPPEEILKITVQDLN